MPVHLQFVLDPDMQILKCIILLWCVVTWSQVHNQNSLRVPLDPSGLIHHLCPPHLSYMRMLSIFTAHPTECNVLHKCLPKCLLRKNAQLHHLHCHSITMKRFQLYTTHIVKIRTLQKSTELWVELPQLQGFRLFHFVWKKYCHSNKLYIS
jgi:hypothetical protein